MSPAVVIRPMLAAPVVNHSAPSAPKTIPNVATLAPLIGGILNSVTSPSTVILPILLPSVNHSAPSGPVVIPKRELAPFTGNSLNDVGVRRPIFGPASVNQIAPSGPGVRNC